MSKTKKSSLALVLLSFFSAPFAAEAAIGSPYLPSNLGYDLSFNSLQYPTSFNFGIIGVTRGKAFVHNNKLLPLYFWAKFGSATAPTFYMNLNAPYGSTVAGHIDTPKTCPPAGAATTTKAGAEPTACQGYNYGYNAAKDAYTHTKNNGVSSALWWLDIEEANSWSKNVAVNDATIQGAIDYLNAQGIRVGIYSMPFMWKNIAGAGFTPTQTIQGKAVPIPTWFPVGIKTLVGAINACVTSTSFIPGSPIWLVQYVANSTAIDQNVAC